MQIAQRAGGGSAAALGLVEVGHVLLGRAQGEGLRVSGDVGRAERLTTRSSEPSSPNGGERAAHDDRSTRRDRGHPSLRLLLKFSDDIILFGRRDGFAPVVVVMKAKKRVRRAGLVELGRGSGMYATSLHVSGDERETETPDGSVGDLSGLHARAAAPVARSPPPPSSSPWTTPGRNARHPERGTSPRQRSPPAAPTPTRARQPGDPGRASHDATCSSQVLLELSRATERAAAALAPHLPPERGRRAANPLPGDRVAPPPPPRGQHRGRRLPPPVPASTRHARRAVRGDALEHHPRAREPPAHRRAKPRPRGDGPPDPGGGVRVARTRRAAGAVETSLDVQFETQRAVRQELAGALSDSARAFDRGSDRSRYRARP